MMETWQVPRIVGACLQLEGEFTVPRGIPPPSLLGTVANCHVTRCRRE